MTAPIVGQRAKNPIGFSASPKVPTVVRAELPHPDVVVVRNAEASHLLLLADVRVSDAEVAAAIADLDRILAGPAYPLRIAADLLATADLAESVTR